MRILVVEDDLGLADNLRRVLEAAQFDCDVACGRAGHGFEMSRSGDYDLVVLEIMLPTMSGFQVCAAIRAGRILMPILMVTAKAGEWDEAESLDTGADHGLDQTGVDDRVPGTRTGAAPSCEDVHGHAADRRRRLRWTRCATSVRTVRPRCSSLVVSLEVLACLMRAEGIGRRQG